MSTGRYRKKPVEIEARQFCGGGAGPCGGSTPDSTSPTHAIYRWIEKNTLGSFDPLPVIEGREPWPESGVAIDPRDGRMIIATLEGGHWVNLFDFIIRGVQGEFYPCKPNIFAATHDEVPVGDPAVAEVTVASSNAAIRVTATDIERGDSQTIEIEDTYVLVTAGRCELTSTTAHANGTHLLTVKNAAGGTKRVVQ